MKPGRRRLLDGSGAEEAAETRKASVRAKNRQRIALLLGFSNLLIAGRYATG